MTRTQKYNYAMELLTSRNIKTVGNQMRLNGNGEIVIHSKQLKNAIIIPPQATLRTISNKINRELSII